VCSPLTIAGDKSAHTATVHIPQMLYVWPYIAFFSAPLLLQPLLQVVYPLLPKQFRAMVDKDVLVHKAFKLPSIQIAGIFVIIAFLAVHFNTIIHPYTLADNRHYVFYVFRILRLYPVLRYLLVPVYYVCAWLSIKALTAPPNDERALRKKHDDLRPTSVETGTGSPCQMSFIVIWLVTTTLSVVTAPLVEPRYFIIPWIIWRLHVQPSSASFLAKGRLATTSYDVRLGLETLWLLAIDATITYVFIHRGFIWPSEPGNVQRFLW
jgi:alpha-1,2-glucosyltransferase